MLEIVLPVILVIGIPFFSLLIIGIRRKNIVKALLDHKLILLTSTLFAPLLLYVATALMLQFEVTHLPLALLSLTMLAVAIYLMKKIALKSF